MRIFLLEGRMVVFKMLTISKIVFLALLTKIPPPPPPSPPPPLSCQRVRENTKIFFLQRLYSKNERTCKDYKDCGLKRVDISPKIVRLQCSWVQRLYDNNFHENKLIPTPFNNSIAIWI